MNNRKIINSVVLSSALLFLGACGTNVSNTTNGNTSNTPNTPNSLINSNKLGKLIIDKRMLAHEDGTGFFWMGDTAWDISKKFWDKEDRNKRIDQYMEDRKAKGFTVIQTSAVSARYFFVSAAFENLQSASIDGHPNINFNSPEDSYWNMIDYIIESARKNNLYIALLPVWNDVLTSSAEAKEYGTFIANRYKDKENIIWVVGGDDPKQVDNKAMWNMLGNTIRGIVKDKQLISYHPPGNKSSTKEFKDAPWLDFHMIQSGHCEPTINANKLLSDTYNDSGNKPVLDAEPRYEEIKRCFSKLSSSEDDRILVNEVREIAYRQLFSGAFGHTYGHHSVWQKYDNGDESKIGGSALDTWQNSLNDAGARQMEFVSKLMRSRPILNRVPDQSMVQSGDAIATRGVGYAFFYLPRGGSITVNLGKISGTQVKAWWFNPQTGDATEIKTYANSGTQVFTTGSDDMVLVLDDTSKNYHTPGQ